MPTNATRFSARLLALLAAVVAISFGVYRYGAVGTLAEAGQPVGFVTPSLFPMSFGDTAAVDAFGRLRNSNPATIFDSKQLFDKAPLFWDESDTGTCTTSTYSSPTTTLNCGAGTGTSIRQTFRRFNYQPGKSQLVVMTTTLGAGVAGATKRVGLFDGSNGIFLEQSGSTLSWVIRSNGVDTNRMAQSAWTLDKLDGSGPSKITLDVTKSQVVFFDFGWLGVQRVRAGFVLQGRIVYATQFQNANAVAGAYMLTPNLPLRYELDVTSGAASLVHLCGTVITEGGREDSGVDLAIDRGSTEIVTQNDASLYPALLLRLKSTNLGAHVEPKKLSVICTSGSSYRWALILNPTVAGSALPAWTSLTNSSVEYQPGLLNTNTVTAGTVLASGYVLSGQDPGVQILPSELVLGVSIAGVSDVLALVVQRVSGTTEHFLASLGFREAT